MPNEIAGLSGFDEQIFGADKQVLLVLSKKCTLDEETL